MTDIENLKELEAKATKGPWETDDTESDGEYGIGDDTHSGFRASTIEAPDGHGGYVVLFDSLNSTASLIEEDHDEDGHIAWDEVARKNAAFIVAMRNALPDLLDAAERKMSNERDTWWLVERRGCQLWATGRGSFHSLTNDATRAERFASKFDAEEEIRCAEDHFRDELVATEHKFIGAVDPEGTNAQLLANALSRAEIAENDLRAEILHSAKMRERAESSESLAAELREKVERLTKALLRLQNGAAVALNVIPEDQQEGVVGNFLAAIHRECCAGLSAGQGADECKGVTP